MNIHRLRGYTLFEVLMTVLIVGILAGTAFALFSNYKERATSAELIESYGVLHEETIIAADTAGIDLCANPPTSLVSNAPSSPYADLSIEKVDLGYGKPIGLHFKADVTTEGEHNTNIARETYKTLNKTGVVAPGAVVNDSAVSFTALFVNPATCAGSQVTAQPQPVQPSAQPAAQAPDTPACEDTFMGDCAVDFDGMCDDEFVKEYCQKTCGLCPGDTPVQPKQPAQPQQPAQSQPAQPQPVPPQVKSGNIDIPPSGPLSNKELLDLVGARNADGTTDGLTISTVSMYGTDGSPRYDKNTGWDFGVYPRHTAGVPATLHITNSAGQTTEKTVTLFPNP